MTSLVNARDCGLLHQIVKICRLSDANALLCADPVSQQHVAVDHVDLMHQLPHLPTSSYMN